MGPGGGLIMDFASHSRNVLCGFAKLATGQLLMLSDAVQRCFWQGCAADRSGSGCIVRVSGVSLMASVPSKHCSPRSVGRCPLWRALRTQVGHRVSPKRANNGNLFRFALAIR